jgi:hypothetical protein
MNPMQMLQMLMKGKNNPQQIVEQMIQGMGGDNPMLSNLMQMAKDGNKQNIEQFARNICKSKGIDFDKEFSSFMSNFKQG